MVRRNGAIGRIKFPQIKLETQLVCFVCHSKTSSRSIPDGIALNFRERKLIMMQKSSLCTATGAKQTSSAPFIPCHSFQPIHSAPFISNWSKLSSLNVGCAGGTSLCSLMSDERMRKQAMRGWGNIKISLRLAAMDLSIHQPNMTKKRRWIDQRALPTASWHQLVLREDKFISTYELFPPPFSLAKIFVPRGGTTRGSLL